MELIVGTNRFLIHLVINDDFEIIDKFFLGIDHYYGAGLENNGAHFYAKRGNANFNIIEYYKRNEEGKYSLFGIRYFPDSYASVHQIARWKNGVVVANTAFNSVGYFDFDKKEHIQYFINDAQNDINHVNSVFPCGDNRVHAMMHNRNRKSELMELKLTKNNFHLERVIELSHKGCHNIFISGDTLMYNASRFGYFIMTNINNIKNSTRVEFSGQHTKGLSISEKYIIVGHSDLAVRKVRDKSNGYISFIDRNSLTLLKTIDLSSSGKLGHPLGNFPVGNVNEVRVLMEKDYGHSMEAALTD
ncbi:MAG: hypothetical protein ABUK01_17610 [Leptospirales bacterium]